MSSENDAGSTLPSVNTSGYRLRRQILLARAAEADGELQDRIDEFKKKAYFWVSQTPDQFKLAMNTFEREFDLLPDDEKGGVYGKEKALIAKMPAGELAEEGEKYLKKIMQRAAMGEPIKYDADTLRVKFAETHRIVHKKAAGKVNAGRGAGGGGAGDVKKGCTICGEIKFEGVLCEILAQGNSARRATLLGRGRGRAASYSSIDEVGAASASRVRVVAPMWLVNEGNLAT